MKTMMGTDAVTHETKASPLVNVGKVERVVTSAAGAGMLLLGLRARSLTGLVAAGFGAGLVYRASTGHCGLYEKLGISTDHSAKEPASSRNPSDFYEKSIHVEESFTIAKPAEELFNFWHNFENLPSFMKHLKSVDDLGEGKSHWVASAPAGQTVEWDAEIINEEHGKLIAWRSLSGSIIDHAGSVRFVPAPGERGTVVKVVLDYITPGGRVGSRIGSVVAKLFGEEPGQQIKEDLRRFKQLMESGETATVDERVRGGN